MTRSSAVRAPAGEPCPFCGCGLPMNATEHKARPRARRIRATEDRSAYPSLFRDHPRSELRDLTDAERLEIEKQAAIIHDRTRRGYRLVARKSRGQWQTAQWELDPLNADAQEAA